MIALTCPKCHEPLEVPESLAGFVEVCPRCQNVCLVPGPSRQSTTGANSFLNQCSDGVLMFLCMFGLVLIWGFLIIILGFGLRGSFRTKWVVGVILIMLSMYLSGHLLHFLLKLIRRNMPAESNKP